MNGATILDVHGVSKTFGALKALTGVDLVIQGTGLHGLIGPNGSGKSTLLKVIAGAHAVDSGRIAFTGRDITKATPYARACAGIALKFQTPQVLPLLPVYDNILLAYQARESPWALMRSITRHTMHQDIMAALERFCLAGRADDLAGELSHGEQQWLEIATALACKPRLLLLDEPTGGMSPAERRLTGRLLEAIKAECALLVVEHDLDFVREICDRLTVLNEGHVLGTGPVAEIQHLPKLKEVYTARV